MAPRSPAPPADPDVRAHTSPPQLIPLAAIDDNPFQPRLAYDPERITAIAASIQTHGLLQVPLARPHPTHAGRYQLAFGHSRFRAYLELFVQDKTAWGAMPLQIRDITDETMALHAWTENKDRADLTAWEEVQAISRFTESFGWTQKQAGEKLHLDRSTIANKLRLLKLPAAAQELLKAGKLSERQAMALVPLAELPPITTPLRLWAPAANGQRYYESVADLIAGAPDLDSATLRRLVESALNAATLALNDQPWAKGTWDVAGVRAAACADCPVRLAQSNRCPDKACATTKLIASRAKQVAKAAAAAGLPASGVTDYGHYTSLDGVAIGAVRTAAEQSGCGNLAVAPVSYGPHRVEGHRGAFIVCAHGQGKRCSCSLSLARAGDPGSKQATEKATKARIRTELVAPAEQVLQAALARPTAPIWRLLLKQVSDGAARKLPLDATVEQLQAALAQALIKDATKYHLEYGADLAGATRSLSALFAQAGVPAPWGVRDPEAALTAIEAAGWEVRDDGDDWVLRPSDTEQRHEQLRCNTAGLLFLAPIIAADPGTRLYTLARVQDEAPGVRVRQEAAPQPLIDVVAAADRQEAPGSLGAICAALEHIEGQLDIGAADATAAGELEALRDDVFALAPFLSDDDYEGLIMRIDAAQARIAGIGVEVGE